VRFFPFEQPFSFPLRFSIIYQERYNKYAVRYYVYSNVKLIIIKCLQTFNRARDSRLPLISYPHRLRRRNLVKSQEYLGAEDNFHEIYTVESSREPALYESFNKKKKLRSVRFLGQIHFNNDFLSIKRKI